MERVHEEDDAGEEESPDWQLLARFINSQVSRKAGPSVEAFIPRRGEKDFEPNDALASTQSKALAQSREALFSALSAGVRGHSSRDHVRCVWGSSSSPDRTSVSSTQTRDEIVPAYVEGVAKGVMFSSIGKWNREKKRLELMPEELLYLIERGTVECWTRDEPESGIGSLPMSVQWAWAEIIGTGGLTLERYQVYGYLRRLGYVVLRKEHVDKLWTMQSSNRPSSSGFHPLAYFGTHLSSTYAWLVDYLSRFQNALWSRSSKLFSPRISAVTMATNSLIRPGVWKSYDSIFKALRIIPSGSAVPTQATLGASVDSKKNERYEVFYYVYKPNNRFPKTAPPRPDFEICVVNSETMPIPTLGIFNTLFDATSPDFAPPAKQPENGGPTTKKWSFASFLLHGSLSFYNSPSSSSPRRARPNIFAALKKGDRNLLLAVVDHGITSFLRFAETDFGGTPLIGGMT